MKAPLVLKVIRGAVPITKEQFLEYVGTEEDIAAGIKRGDVVTFGPWSIIRKYRALAVEAEWVDNTIVSYTLYGNRSLSSPKNMGYDLEGHVSIGGKRRSAFTSSVPLELPDGASVDVEVIFARSLK